MASVSGLAVASLQLLNERYRPYKGTCVGACIAVCSCIVG